MKMTDKEKAERYEALMTALKITVDDMYRRADEAKKYTDGKNDLNAFEAFQYGLATGYEECGKGIERMIS